jgi:transposase
MSLEDRVGVIAKARFQSVHFAWANVAHAQLINTMWRSRSMDDGEAERCRDSTKKT